MGFGQEAFDLVSRWHRRLRARACHRQCAGGAGKSYRIIEFRALGTARPPARREGIARGRRVHTSTAMGGPRLTPRRGHQAAPRGPASRAPQGSPREQAAGAAVDRSSLNVASSDIAVSAASSDLVGGDQRRQRQELIGDICRGRRIEEQRAARRAHFRRRALDGRDRDLELHQRDEPPDAAGKAGASRSGVKVPLAPATTTISFWPSASVVMSATPLETLSSVPTRRASTPASSSDVRSHAP